MGIPISNVTRRVVYEASGTGPYNFTFEILANTDVAVYKDDALLTLTTDYTVTINTNGTGYITLVASPTGADQIAIVGNRTIQRTTDFVTGGDFFANTVNDEMDQQTIFAQQNAEAIDRSLKAPQTDPTSINMTLPRAALRAGKTLAFDQDGNPSLGDTLGTNRGNWASGTLYYVRDIVKDTSTSNIWQCVTQHTSSGSQPISTNADAAKWFLLVDAEAAGDSATAAAASASAASTSASNASTSATNAASSASTASTQASNASTSATNAASSATAAASSASTASTAATNAGNSATAAATSATNASNSASSASTSATNASNSATSAATSASNASTSATAAASSASTASTQASNAATSATNAANSATASASSATAAAGSATSAANSATAASGSATSAATSATDAADSAADAAASAASVGFDASSTTTFTNKTMAAATNNVEARSGPDGSSFGFRNRIINGAMMIDQRNNGASVTPAAPALTYTVDRWGFFNSTGTNRFSAQRNAGSVTPPAGFTNYLGFTVTSAYTPSGADEQFLSQQIEGFNVADLGWGTSNAQAVTATFWVRSSITGTHSGAVRNPNGYSRSYPFTFTVSAANTWEQKTITIPGDTGGTWNTNNAAGIQFGFNLGSGPSSLGTASVWSATNAFTGATGSVQVSATNGATFYITGVQLEAGSVATPFERRPYGTELMLCQRYYYRSSMYTNGWGEETNVVIGSIPFPVTMRTQPSVNNDADSSGVIGNGSLYNMTAGTAVINNGWSGNNTAWVQFGVNAQITRWTAVAVRVINFQASAEL